MESGEVFFRFGKQLAMVSGVGFWVGALSDVCALDSALVVGVENFLNFRALTILHARHGGGDVLIFRSYSIAVGETH